MTIVNDYISWISLQICDWTFTLPFLWNLNTSIIVSLGMFSIRKCLHFEISGLTKHYCAPNTMCITISEETTCFGLVLVCHSGIPMPGEQPQYGILILMTDERASQVSHSSWRTKASHNKSRLIPEPWAPPTRKTKRWVLFTKASYYSREPHVATLSIKLCLIEERGWAVLPHLIWGNQRYFLFFTLPYLLLKHSLSHSLFYFLITSTCSLLSNYRLVFHLLSQGMEW